MDTLHTIRNFLPLSDRVATAGQPTADQLVALRDGGFEVVINLALRSSTYALPDERAVVAGLGMQYVHIPVDFERPTEDDARQFFAAMDAAADRKVFVHCAMNLRVSAFMYLYRTLRQGMDEETAAADLDRVWTPNAVWQSFIDRVARELRAGPWE
jgi:protein tyrosine phosphatase (PTP) superfamily phosphohydrolase (DUF442 family)